MTGQYIFIIHAIKAKLNLVATILPQKKNIY